MNKVSSISGVNTDGLKPEQTPVKAVCPKCNHKVTFDGLNGIADMRANNGALQTEIIAGVRACPDPVCRALIHFERLVDAKTGEVLVTIYPPSGIPFDTSDIPTSVVEAFREALECYRHGLYIAAALMVRKTIEEVCHEQKIKGDNLEKRIEAFKKTVILPAALVDSLHDLRLLGNDAAHIESRHFNDVGHPELDISIQLVTELLKAMYQHQALQKQLAAFKKTRSP